MQSVAIHSTALTSTSNFLELREGSSVFVRILNQTGPSSFEAAFAGSRFSVASDIPLKPGENFKATVRLVNGQVQLIPLSDSRKITINGNSNFTSGLTSSVSSYLANLGIVPDDISLAAFTQMKLLGLKLNLPVFNKIRSISMKFPGKEGKAASVAMIMLKKGIEITADNISLMMNVLDRSGEGWSHEEGFSQRGNRFFEKNDAKSEFKKFFINLFSGINVEENQDSLSKDSILAVFNHKGFDFSRSSIVNNWVHIPFDFSFEKYSELKQGSGFVNLLIEERSLKSSVLSFGFPENQYKFILNFTGNKCSSIYYCNQSPVDEELKNQIENALLKNNLCSQNFASKSVDPSFFYDFEIDIPEFMVIRENV